VRSGINSLLSKLRNWVYLNSNFCLVRPASTPNDQAKHGEDNHKGKDSNQSLEAPCETLVLKLMIRPFFQNHITLRPPLIIPLPTPFPSRRWPENPRKAARGRVPWVTPEWRVWGRLHRTVWYWSCLHWRWLVPIMRIPWRTLHIVHRPLWWSWRWRWS